MTRLQGQSELISRWMEESVFGDSCLHIVGAVHWYYGTFLEGAWCRLRHSPTRAWTNLSFLINELDGCREALCYGQLLLQYNWNIPTSLWRGTKWSRGLVVLKCCFTVSLRLLDVFPGFRWVWHRVFCAFICSPTAWELTGHATS